MPNHYQFTLALKALREIQSELGQVPAEGKLLFPGLADMLESIGHLPNDCLLFGIAGDGLPMLLNMRDPRPGPILITGDQGSGKTDFLKTLALCAARFSDSERLNFIVLTDFVHEWANINVPDAMLEVRPAYEPETSEMIYDLARTVQIRDALAPVILLFDGLDSVLGMDEATQYNLSYLFSHGPQTLLWPIVTVNSERAVQMPEWLAFFHTRIYGRVANPQTAEALTHLPGAALNTLFSGFQFSIREKSKWLKFWLPNLSM